MFIKRLELHNFANIESGLGLHKLTIDLSSQAHTVCVIAGGNGKGKTSILSYLTPFATTGNLDIRDGDGLIIKGEKGFKRIVIVDNDDTYDIQHHYTPEKDSITIKSFIQRNGVELNANGNVRSFKEYVADLLGLEMDYLKLIRIGDNISNLIKLKSTERKTFMGKILEDIDAYLKDYKLFSQKEREEKAVLSHIIDEIAKTGISDAEEQEKLIQKKEKELAQIKEKSDSANASCIVIEQMIKEIDFPENGDVRIKELVKKLESLSKSSSDIPKDKDVKFFSDRVIQIEIELSALWSMEEPLVSEKKMRQEDLDKFMVELLSQENELSKIEDNADIRSMSTYLDTIRGNIQKLSKIKGIDIDFPFTLEQLSDFIVTLKNIQVILNVTYSVGKEPIKLVLKKMRKREDIDNFIRGSIMVLESNQNSNSITTLDRLVNKYADAKYECMEDCPYKRLHAEIKGIKDTRPVDDVRYTTEFYQMMKIAYENLVKVIDIFKEKKEFISLLPKSIQEMFSMESVFSHIEKSETIFDEHKINELLSIVSDRKTYVDLIEEEKKVSSTLSLLTQNSNLQLVRDTIGRLKDSIGTIKNRISEINSILSENFIKITALTEEKNRCNTYIEFLTDFNGYKEEYDSLIEKLKHAQELHTKLESETDEAKKILLWYEEGLRSLHKDETNLTRFKELQKEFEDHKTIYEDLNHLKFAASNRTGIPIYFIEMYLGDTIDIANDLLDIVYDGDLYLDRFSITENEFRIPYVKNGIEVSDVVSSSQGEQSFINMAISSALRIQTISKYNVMLFDEVDGPFDDGNRQKFIPVLERQLELGSVRQAFLITHNQMFQKYGVDKIDLDVFERSTVEIYGE